MLRSAGNLPDRELHQGDIIADVPFLVFPRNLNIKSGTSGQIRLQSDNPQSFERLKELTELKGLQTTVAVIPQTGIVITQSCDLEHKDNFALARVFPLRELIKNAKDALEHSEPLVLFDIVRTISETTDYGHLAYLGAPDGETRLAADLLRVQSFSQNWKECFRQRRIASLNDEALRYLQGRLVVSSGRYAAQDRFWMMPEDQSMADQILKDPSALNDAYNRLSHKTKPS